MNSVVRIPLQANPLQFQRLLDLQREFARACNAVAPLVQETRTWNRVALHHLAYRKLRESFPGIGSQMACNAIYSVSRAARLVFQAPGSPFHHARMVGQTLPRLHFLETSPVYFDRHTLSIKAGQASMYTLDGRMKFHLALLPEQELAFHQRKLLEASLMRVGGNFELHFSFGPALAGSAEVLSAPVATPALPEAGESVASGLQDQAPATTAPVPTHSGLPSYLTIEASA